MPPKSTRIGWINREPCLIHEVNLLLRPPGTYGMLMKLSDQNLKSRIQQWICLFPQKKGLKFEEMYTKPLDFSKNQRFSTQKSRLGSMMFLFQLDIHIPLTLGLSEKVRKFPYSCPRRWSSTVNFFLCSYSIKRSQESIHRATVG